MSHLWIWILPSDSPNLSTASPLPSTHPLKTRHHLGNGNSSSPEGSTSFLTKWLDWFLELCPLSNQPPCLAFTLGAYEQLKAEGWVRPSHKCNHTLTAAVILSCWVMRLISLRSKRQICGHSAASSYFFIICWCRGLCFICPRFWPWWPHKSEISRWYSTETDFT